MIHVPFIKKIFRNKWQTVSIILMICLVIALVQYVRVRNQIAHHTTDEILQKLSKNIVLPSDIPQIVPITNVALYKTNWPDFYKDAQPTDILIQYPNSSFLYDPVKNKILNFASSGVFNKPKPADVLHISFRFNGNELYRALFLKRQIEEDGWNSAYQITEVVLSKALYKNDVIYLVNSRKKDLALQFAKTIGDSPIIEKLEPNEAPTTADIIVSFRSMP